MTYNPYLHHGFPPGLMPMAGLALPQLGQMGVTVPTGVASVSAPPVRNIVTEQPSLLGAYPGMNVHMPHNGMHFPPQFHLQHQPMLHVKKPPPVEPTGPLITVFVGNITERAPDMLVRQLLSKCGSVNNWKRAQGANGKLQAFGFCDFSDPESAMRAIRILHQFDIADKKLVVKAGDKARELLIEYLKQKRPNVTASLEDEVDADTKRQDDDIRAQIVGILREHEIDLSKDMDNSGRDRSKKSDRNRGGESKANEGSIADMEMEEEKRSLIHREIDKFRDTYKALCYIYCRDSIKAIIS